MKYRRRNISMHVSYCVCLGGNREPRGRRKNYLTSKSSLRDVRVTVGARITAISRIDRFVVAKGKGRREKRKRGRNSLFSRSSPDSQYTLFRWISKGVFDSIGEKEADSSIINEYPRIFSGNIFSSQRFILCVDGFDQCKKDFTDLQHTDSFSNNPTFCVCDDGMNEFHMICVQWDCQCLQTV